MIRAIAGLLLVCVGLFGSESLLAHHSAVLFDLSKTFTLTGTMTKLDWRNPHVGVFVDVKGDRGRIEAWEFETGAPSWFRGRSLTRGDFARALGQAVTVEAVRAKDGSRFGYLYQIVFQDGHSMELR